MKMVYVDTHSYEYFQMTLRQLAYNLEQSFSKEELSNRIFINGDTVGNVGDLRSIEEDGFISTLKGSNTYSAMEYIDGVLRNELVADYKIMVKRMEFKGIHIDKLYINPFDSDPKVTHSCVSNIDITIDYFPDEGESISDIIKSINKNMNATTLNSADKKEDIESLSGINGRATAGSGISEVNLKSGEKPNTSVNNDFAYDDMQFWWHIDSNNPNPNSKYKDIPNANMRDYENHIDLETAVDVMTRNGFEYCLDQKGHMVLRSIASVYDYNPSYKMSPFHGTQFILLDIADANNIRDMLDEAIIANNSEADDYNAFGDKAISYERLYDALNGMMSPPPSYQKFAFSLSALLDNIKDYCSHCCNQIDTNTIVTFVVNGSHTPAYSYNDFKDAAVNGKPHYSEYRTVELFRWIDVLSYGIKQRGDIGMGLKKFKFAYTGATRGFEIYGQMYNPPALTIYLDY